MAAFWPLFRRMQADMFSRVTDLGVAWPVHRAGRRRGDRFEREGSQLIALDDVSKRYPNGTFALRDVDLRVDAGDFIFLVGSSGAGKSTLIRLLIREELATTRSRGRRR